MARTVATIWRDGFILGSAEWDGQELVCYPGLSEEIVSRLSTALAAALARGKAEASVEITRRVQWTARLRRDQYGDQYIDILRDGLSWQSIRWDGEHILSGLRYPQEPAYEALVAVLAAALANGQTEASVEVPVSTWYTASFDEDDEDDEE